MIVSLHALAALISSVLAFLCGRRSWSHYRDTRNEYVKLLALDFFSMSAATLMLVFPAALFRSDLLPIFLALAVFFLYLGVSFFLRLVVSLFGNISRFNLLVFFVTVAIGTALALLTFLTDPFLTFAKSGLVAAYHFSSLLKGFLLVFIIVLTSLFSGVVFIRQVVFALVFITRLRAFLFGLALLCIGLGVFLVVLGEGIWYNLFIVLAFLLFYASVSLRGKERYGKF